MESEIKKYSASGPIFEPRPGWGGQLKSWLNTNWQWVLPTALLVILLLIIGSYLNRPSQQTADTANQTLSPTPFIDFMTISINKGDSKTLVARHALALYLTANPDINLSPEQKLHAENLLVAKVTADQLIAGAKLEFNPDNILIAITAAQKLTPSQLAKYRAYLK